MTFKGVTDKTVLHMAQWGNETFSSPCIPRSFSTSHDIKFLPFVYSLQERKPRNPSSFILLAFNPAGSSFGIIPTILPTAINPVIIQAKVMDSCRWSFLKIHTRLSIYRVFDTELAGAALAAHISSGFLLIYADGRERRLNCLPFFPLFQISRQFLWSPYSLMHR